MVPVLQKADLPIDTTTSFPQTIYSPQIQDINSPKYLHEQTPKALVPKELQKRSTSGHGIALINMGMESRDKTTETLKRKGKISAHFSPHDEKRKIHSRKGRSQSRLSHHTDDDDDYLHHSSSSSNDDRDGEVSDNGSVDFSSLSCADQDKIQRIRHRTQSQTSPVPRSQPKLKHLYGSSDSDESDHSDEAANRSAVIHKFNGKASTEKNQKVTGTDSNTSSARPSPSHKRRPGRPRKDECGSSKAAENSDSDESVRSRRRERQTTSDSTASKGKYSAFDPNRTDKAGRTRLFSCTGTGNLDRVKELIDMGASVNWRDNAGWTPLHEAALKGQADVAKYLLSCGAEVNARGFGNDTPLHDACSNGFNECVQILIDHGANINIKNSDGHTPVDVCEDDDCIEILNKRQKELERLSVRDKAGRTSLHRACAAGQLEEALNLIKKGADVNVKDNASWTPLHEAALNGYLDIVKKVCEHGSQLNPTGYDGSTPLHEASENGHGDVVRYLLEMGADKTIRNKNGQTAAEVSDDKSVQDLFFAELKVRLASPVVDAANKRPAANVSAPSQGASPTDEKPSTSKKPLSREEKKIQALMETFQKMEKRQSKKAKRRPHRQHDDDDDEEDDDDESTNATPKEPEYRTKRLVRGRPRSASVSQSREASEEATQPKKPTAKLDPKRKDTAGRTQLHKWAVRGDEAAVRELLEAGANANEKDHAGWTPLHEAALRGRLEVLKLLLQHGADPNALGADKDTPLHDAVENGHGDVVRVLLEHGANANARNATDLDCLQIAKDNEDDEMIAILKAAQKQYPATGPASATSRQPKIEPISEQEHLSLKTSKSAVADLAVSVKKMSDPSEDVLDPDRCSNGKGVKKRRLVTAAEYRSRSHSQERKKSEESMSDLPHGAKVKVERKLPHALAGGFDIFNVSPSPHRKHVSSNGKRSPIVKEWTSDHNNDAMEMKKVKREQEDTDMSPSKKKFWPSLSHAIQYLPLYTVQLQDITPSKDRAFYVVDLQVRLLLGISNLSERYPHLEKRLVTEREKERLWSPLAFMVSERCAQAVKAGCGISKDKEDLNIKLEKGFGSGTDISRTKEQEKQRFLQTDLYFIRLEQIISIIKNDYSHLSNNLITITLDIGYSPTSETPQEKVTYPSTIPSTITEAEAATVEESTESPASSSLPIKRPAFGLPAKFAMKMQRCGLGHKRDVSK